MEYENKSFDFAYGRISYIIAKDEFGFLVTYQDAAMDLDHITYYGFNTEAEALEWVLKLESKRQMED